MGARWRRRARIVMAVVVGASASAGCAAILGIEDTTDEPRAAFDGEATADRSPPDGGAEVDAAPEADGVDACPSTRGPRMVRVEAGFCVDSTEVTRGDYAAFMEAAASNATQSPECAFNTSFAPVGWPYAPDADLAVPAGVDWCDAVAYCRWAGKRLCGARADGGVVPIAQGSDPAVSEWTSACSRGGTRTYPYGSTYDPTRCNGGGRDAGRVLPVAAMRLCEGGDPGLFDMSGNAWEWDATCVLDDAGRPRQCGQRGGGHTDPATLLVCALTNYQNIALRLDNSGFRCCAR